MTARLQILLVEDTPSDIRLTQEALKDSDLDYELNVVNDGEQAMDYLRKNVGKPTQPQLILLDLNMPKKNGHEVLQDMQKIPEYKQTTVILLTVSRDEDDILKALDMKMNYYLGKPVSADKLNSLLKAIWELTQADIKAHNLEGEDTHIRYVLAGNPHTSPAVLTKLATEKHPKIRMRVAENPNAPAELLEKLATDSDPDVRLGVADNPSAPEKLLERLAQDQSDDVRLGLASNPKIPQHILKRLATDEQPHVAASANRALTA